MRDHSFFLMKNTGALIRDFDGRIHLFAKFSWRNSSSSFCSAGERGNILPLGSLALGWSSMAWSHALRGGRWVKAFLRRHLQSPCSTLGQHFQAGGLVGLEPPLLVFARGSRWCKCVPPTLGSGGSCTLYLRVRLAAPAPASRLVQCNH